MDPAVPGQPRVEQSRVGSIISYQVRAPGIFGRVHGLANAKHNIARACRIVLITPEARVYEFDKISMQSNRRRQTLGSKVAGNVARHQRKRHAIRIVLIRAGKQVVLQTKRSSTDRERFIRCTGTAGNIIAGCPCLDR